MNNDFGVIDQYSGQDALYALANMASYAVPIGPITLRYGDGHVQMHEQVLADGTGLCIQSYVGNTINVNSGWSFYPPYQINPAPEPAGYLKGTLSRRAVTQGGGAKICKDGDGDHYQTQFQIQVTLSLPNGQLYNFYPTDYPMVTGSWKGGGNGLCTQTYTTYPAQYWSQTANARLDLSNACMPVVHYADGSKEEFYQPVDISVDPQDGYTQPPRQPGTGCNRTGDLRHVDTDGNVTTFHNSNAQTQQLIDPLGRTTTLNFDVPNILTHPELASVVTSGPGGDTLTTTINWATLATNLDSMGVPCHTAGNPTTMTPPQVTSCGTGSVREITSVVLPTGQEYSFSYGSWGNLTQVTEPSGSVHKYTYGVSSTAATAFIHLSTPEQRASTSCTVWDVNNNGTSSMIPFEQDTVASETVYPLGANGPGYTTQTTYQDVPNVTHVWTVKTRPDKSVHRIAHSPAVTLPPAVYRSRTCAGGETGKVLQSAWPLAEETTATDGVTLLEETYYSDMFTASYTTNYYAYDSFPIWCSGNAYGDLRLMKEVHYKDRIYSTKTTSYGDTVPVGTGSRDTTNVTATCLFTGTSASSCTNPNGATKLIETDNSYSQFHTAPYLAQQLLHLLQQSQVFDGSGNTLNLSQYNYDLYGLAPSGQPGLDKIYTNQYRGNPTLQYSYTSSGSYIPTQPLLRQRSALLLDRWPRQHQRPGYVLGFRAMLERPHEGEHHRAKLARAHPNHSPRLLHRSGAPHHRPEQSGDLHTIRWPWAGGGNRGAWRYLEQPRASGLWNRRLRGRFRAGSGVFHERQHRRRFGRCGADHLGVALQLRHREQPEHPGVPRLGDGPSGELHQRRPKPLRPLHEGVHGWTRKDDRDLQSHRSEHDERRRAQQRGLQVHGLRQHGPELGDVGRVFSEQHLRGLQSVAVDVRGERGG
jgi:hypothetical protein